MIALLIACIVAASIAAYFILKEDNPTEHKATNFAGRNFDPLHFTNDFE